MSPTLQPSPKEDSGKNNKTNGFCQYSTQNGIDDVRDAESQQPCPNLFDIVKNLTKSATTEQLLRLQTELRQASVMLVLMLLPRETPLQWPARTSGSWQDAMDSGE